MQKTLRILFFFFFLISASGTLRAGGMHFIENRGQWDKEVLFRAEIPGGFLFLKKHSFVYSFYDASQVKKHHAAGSAHAAARENVLPGQTINAHGVEVQFLGAAAEMQFVYKNELETHYNYFLGSDPATWVRGVRAFEEVIYKNLYKGIDLRVYLHQFKLKYEFVVAPGADPTQIRLKYNGAAKLSLNDKGELVIGTSVTEFREGQPYSFQKTNARTTDVPSKFVLGPDQTVHFELGNTYQKNAPLTIDPELIFSTYSGSAADNWGHTATYDGAGNLYSGGTVFGSDFPATTGAFQVRFGGLVDVALMKFNADGSQLEYATFLGGDQTDLPTSLIVNSKNELLVLGTTSSKNFPVGANAFQKIFGGGFRATPISGLDLLNGSDIFVSKLSADGKQLLGSTYLGGEGNDGVCNSDNFAIRNYGDPFRGEIVTDQADGVTIVSSTSSAKFPLKNAVQNTLQGSQDGIVARFDSNLSTLLWSTYIGGEKEDAAYAVKVMPDATVYIAGASRSTKLPASVKSYQNTLKGEEDAFVAKYTADKLAALTYLGTDKHEVGYMIDTDPAGNVYVYGLTDGDYPVSQGVYQNAKSGQFIHALDANLSASVLSTVIGSGRGTPDISPTAFLVSECGNIYIAGWGGNVNTFTGNNLQSSTNGMVVTDDAMQPTTNGHNFYVAILEQGAKSLLYATYFGSQSRNGDIQGDHVDGGTSRFDKNGTIYHATCACGGSYFPVTPQAWSKTNNSDNCNNAAFKIDIDRLVANFDVYKGSQKDVVRGCAPFALNFVNTSEGGVDYIWEVNGATISREEDQAEYEFKQPGEYTVTLKAYNRLSCKRIDIAQKKIIVETLTTKVTADTAVCENSTVKLFASGGTQYKWSPAAGLDNPTSATPTAIVKENTTYSVEISNASGCKVTEDVKIAVQRKNDFVEMPDTEVCAGATVVLTVSGEAKSYKWLATNGLPETIGNSVTVKPTQTTTYVIEGQYADGCRPLREITVKVDQSHQPDFEIVTSGGACNEPFSYAMVNKTSNAQRYEWNLGAGNTVTDKDVQTYTYENPGEYTVTLTSYNAAGCALSSSKTVKAAPPFTLTNVITPNDDGKNDFFIVPVSPSSLEVFNRWGKSVFKSADYKNDWGAGVQNGTYFYVVETPQGNHCKGWVEVLH